VSWIDYNRAHPEVAEEFAEAMTSSTRAFDEAILEADPFPPFRQVVDVGGSHGSLLRRLLERDQHARGVVFDLPEVVERVAGLDGRLTTVGGDFFHAVPPGGDLYLLKFILHDWDDERAARILRRVREAVAAGGRVAIVEFVLPDEPVSHPAWIMDLNMLAMTGGRERSERRHRALLEQTGWRFERTVPTASAISVILATPDG
jgi:hypothetical protein